MLMCVSSTVKLRVTLRLTSRKMNRKKRALIVFIVSLVAMWAILFLFPINLFDGELDVKRGLYEATESRTLALSNFIGIGTEGMEEYGVVDFRLTGTGWLLAGIFLIGFPVLVGYRVYLGKRSEIK